MKELRLASHSFVPNTAYGNFRVHLKDKPNQTHRPSKTLHLSPFMHDENTAED